MKCNLYVIFDKIADEGGVPFDAKNDEIAKRKFEDVINRQIRPVKTVSVSDYELRQVGMFDTENCKLDTCGFEEAGARFVCNGSEVNEWTVEAPIDMAKIKEQTAQMFRNFGQSPELGPQIQPIKAKKKHFWSK